MAFNILIVDDSKVVRAVVAKTLQLSGLPLGDIHEAEHGREALDRLKENWVDLILADINMPVMGGVEMIEQLASDGVLKSTPVVVISTEGSSTVIQHLTGLGVAGFLRKPFQPEQFSELIQNILGKAHV